jgi:Polyketide cyclase / dehydrase and lipid transport
MLPLRHESSGLVQSPMDQVFAHLDDHTRLSSHMSEPSWRTGGGRMDTELDEGRGQKVGARIRLSGRVFGVALSVEEIVVERDPPHRKVWATTGAPKLLVIGHYRMGFELSPQGNGSMLRVFIEYSLPEAGLALWLGRLFGRYYARWCTQQMVDDAVKHFETRPATQRSV